jgi:hypothetical protein
MRHQLDTRVDQSFSASSKLYVRYSLTNRDDQVPGPYDAPLIGTTGFQQAIKDQMSHNVAIGQQFNGITSARSGTPFTPRLSVNPAQSGHPRPDRVGDGNLPRSERSAARWFDPSAFATPVPFNYGTAGAEHPDRPGLLQHRLRAVQAIQVRRADAAQGDPDPAGGIQRLQPAALPPAECDRRSARRRTHHRNRRDNARDAARGEILILEKWQDRAGRGLQTPA